MSLTSFLPLSIYPSFHSLCLPVSLSLSLSLSLSVSVSVYLPMSVCLSVRPSLCLSISGIGARVLASPLSLGLPLSLFELCVTYSIGAGNPFLVLVLLIVYFMHMAGQVLLHISLS